MSLALVVIVAVLQLVVGGLVPAEAVAAGLHLPLDHFAADAARRSS